DAVEMVLGQPHHIGAERVGERRLAQGLVDDLAVAARVAAVGEQEGAELHRPPPRCCTFAPAYMNRTAGKGGQPFLAPPPRPPHPGRSAALRTRPRMK